MSDYIPKGDAARCAYADSFITVIKDHVATLAIDEKYVRDLEVANAEFRQAIAEADEALARSKAAVAKKNASSAAVEPMLRMLAAVAKHHPAMSDEVRAQLGIKSPSSKATKLEMGDEVPEVSLETLPGMVIVHFGADPWDESANSRPEWAKGANIYRRRTGEQGYTLLATVSSSPYIDAITGSSADYTYTVRYRGAKASELGKESVPMDVTASELLAA